MTGRAPRSDHEPPRWLERLLERALPDGLSGQAAVGDLAEEFGRRAARAPYRARMWYAGQVASVLAYRALGRGGGPGPRKKAGAPGPRGSGDLMADLRWSLRLVLRHPGFALGVVAVLGLGLGANAAVFSVVDGTFRSTSWWSAPEQMVAIWPDNHFSFGQLTLYQDEQTLYRSVGGYAEMAYAVRTGDGESESVNGVAITPALFRELAAQPVMGRPLADDDAVVGVEPAVVLGESLWRRSFGADPGVLGSTVRVSGTPARVVGIQPAEARAPGGRAELWFPLVVDPRSDDYFRLQNLSLVGALRDGATPEDALADLMAFTDRLSRMFPMFFPPGFAEGKATVARADESQRSMISTPLLLLLGGTGLLLVVTALNVGNLLLGRAIGRRKELAVRAALGAGRWRIARQLLVEGAVLTGAAVAMGLATGGLAGPWIADLFVGEVVVTSSSVLSPAVLLPLLAASLAAWLVLSGVPVAHFLRTRQRGIDPAPPSGARVQRGLVAVQAALATLLLASAALLVATVDNLRQVPLGFEPDAVLTVELSPPQDRLETVARARELYTGLTERVSALPGVEAAGLTGWLPLRAPAPPTPLNLASAPVDPARAVKAPLHKVDPGFFRALGVRPSDGRLLGSEDRADVPRAVVVNETLARMLWPDASPVGQRMAVDPHAWDRWATVVGVVPDLRSGEITGPTGPALYVPLAESPSRDVTLVVKATGGAGALPAAVRRAVREVDPLVPIREMSWMKQVVRRAYATSWVVMGLLVVLAVLATGLGAIGIYAVLAHHVATSRKEIGIRMALGAEPLALVARVVRSGVGLAGMGIVAGSLGALLLSRYLESLLFGVSTWAPVAYLVPALAMTAAAALAAWIPAARAGRLPPSEVLRAE